MTPLDQRDLVAALRAVPGITDAGIEPDGIGGLGLLRLDLEPGADEAGVASTVGRLLRDRFGMGVDTDRAQVVPDLAAAPGAPLTSVPAGEPTPAPIPTPAPVAAPDVPPVGISESTWTPAPPVPVVPAQRDRTRPAISQLHLVSSGLDVTASVTLSSGQQRATGEIRGSASQAGVHRAVAAATLRAVELLVDLPVRFELEHLEITPTGSDRTVLVVLSMLSSRGTERLTGAAGVREDVRQAIVRASLDALNRRLEMLLVEA